MDIIRLKWLGSLPLAFFAYATFCFIKVGEWPHLLWVCHLSNILLSLGLFWQKSRLVWISFLWILTGTGLWAINVALYDPFTMHSMLLHVGALFVAVDGVDYCQLLESPIWWPRILYCIGVQIICHFITPPAFNVNMSHGVFKPLEGIISSYSLYWIGSTLGFSLLFFFLERVLPKWLPNRYELIRSSG